jgi:hypothetical protein
MHIQAPLNRRGVQTPAGLYRITEAHLILAESRLFLTVQEFFSAEAQDALHVGNVEVDLAAYDAAIAAGQSRTRAAYGLLAAKIEGAEVVP